MHGNSAWLSLLRWLARACSTPARRNGEAISAPISCRRIVTPARGDKADTGEKRPDKGDKVARRSPGARDKLDNAQLDIHDIKRKKSVAWMLQIRRSSTHRRHPSTRSMQWPIATRSSTTTKTRATSARSTPAPTTSAPAWSARPHAAT
ncbi:hypothetical protein BVIET440_50251 [Burkholderia vietnamiensis]